MRRRSTLGDYCGHEANHYWLTGLGVWSCPRCVLQPRPSGVRRWVRRLGRGPQLALWVLLVLGLAVAGLAVLGWLFGAIGRCSLDASRSLLPALDRGAELSSCGTYRYRLWRRWSEAPPFGFVMLNPSTADANVDDPTIRRCCGFARSLGAGGIEVVNLFAYRATDPTDLLRASKRGTDIVGPDGDASTRDMLGRVEHIIAAWGARGGLLRRDEQVISLIVPTHALHCLRRSEVTGMPEHPLYLPAALRPVLYAARTGGPGGL